MKMREISREPNKKLVDNNNVKKKKEIVDEIKELFLSKGIEAGTRLEMLNYVWDYCIKPQLGLSKKWLK